MTTDPTTGGSALATQQAVPLDAPPPAGGVRPLILAGDRLLTGQELAVTFPYDGREVARVALGDEAIVERALAAADAARAELAALPPFRRAEILNRAADLVAERVEELALQMTLETGNAIWETRMEVRRTVEILRGAAEESRRITGEQIPIDGWPNGEGRYALTRRFPVGPVLGITPFNAPLLLVAHKLAPALAAGCPCIIRPATKTPLSALSLGEIVLEAGAPPAAVSVVPCPTALGEAMARDERIKALSFTGSGEVGWHLRRVAAPHRITLELGGNGAVIVHEDANVAYAAKRVAFGGFLRSGQACISVQRLFVHESIAAGFEAALVGEIEGMALGDPSDDATIIGCLVDERAADAAMAVIDEARSAGARVLCGGTRLGPTSVAPTLLADVPTTARACASEVFAPIVAIATYSDVDAAIEAAGETVYGLQAGIFTNDLRIVERAYSQLEVGGVIVNDVNTYRVDHMPYGGERRSGSGREGVRFAIRDFTQERLLVVDPR
jgi:glyceraldehyde-3-phosphate dehydrogenase (NADP+)